MMNRILRIVLGLVFVAQGINGLFNLALIPVPEFHPFMQILVETRYIHVVKMIELLGGLMLLTNHFVPLGLTILGPIAVNIVLYHILIDARLPYLGFAVFALWCVLMWTHREHFEALLVKDIE